MSLTLKKVTNLKGKPGRYFDRDGLCLQVPTPGEKMPRQSRASWILRYELSGRERWMGLGALTDFELDEARELARKARQLKSQGIDPLDARNAERLKQKAEAATTAARTVTFKEAAESFFKFHSPKWTNKKHTDQFLSSLKAYAFPVLGHLPVAAIDIPLVKKAIEPIWQTKTATASRVRNRIESVLDYAKVNGWREGENPAAWTGNLKHLLPAPSLITRVQHLKALPFVEMYAFITTLQSQTVIAARSLEFLILTAARSGEAIGARWSEIDLTGRVVWTISAERMKAGKEHRVPLSDRAVELLKALPRESDFVFPGLKAGRPLGHNELTKMLARIRAGFTVHGFRSSFRDWAAERTTYPDHICEAALAHSVGNAVERAYKRTDLFDKRRKLMEAWSKFCFSKPTATAMVVPIRRAV